MRRSGTSFGPRSLRLRRVPTASIQTNLSLSSPTSRSTPCPRTIGSSSVAGSPMPRPEVLDNLAAETTHARGLSYLVEDIPAAHGLSVATGYVNLGGLHHLATIAEDDRP